MSQLTLSSGKTGMPGLPKFNPLWIAIAIAVVSGICWIVDVAKIGIAETVQDVALFGVIVVFVKAILNR